MSNISTPPKPPPPIFAPPRRSAIVSPMGRLLAAVIAGGCLAVLVVAAGLTPDATGVGTHHQLGMHPCGWLENTGIPCPTCGMTTSFAWFARGHIPGSLHAQPMGTILAAIAAATFWIGLYIAATGRPIHRMLERLPMSYWLFPLLILAFAAWAWKVAIHLATGGGGGA